MPYIIEREDQSMEFVDGDFNAEEVPLDGVKSIYVISKTYSLQQRLVCDTPAKETKPRMYTMPDGTKKTTAEMTEEEKAVIFAPMINARKKAAEEKRIAAQAGENGAPQA